MFPLFQHLPDDILLSIMSNWISLDDDNFRDLRKLDSAICEKQLREQYLRCVRILFLSNSFTLYLERKEASMQSLNQWIKSRDILQVASNSPSISLNMTDREDLISVLDTYRFGISATKIATLTIELDGKIRLCLCDIMEDRKMWI